jgi:hypothetical protein
VTQRILTGALAATLLAASACDRPVPVSPTVPDAPLFAQAPADGSGNKLVFTFDDAFPVTCGAQTLSVTARGWLQIRVFGSPRNRNVELGVFHGVLTYANSAGETFVWHDVGPDHYYLDNGDFVVSVVGTSTASGSIERDQTVIGRVVLNLTTGDVQFIAGRELGRIDDLACAALT